MSMSGEDDEDEVQFVMMRDGGFEDLGKKGLGRRRSGGGV